MAKPPISLYHRLIVSFLGALFAFVFLVSLIRWDFFTDDLQNHSFSVGLFVLIVCLLCFLTLYAQWLYRTIRFTQTQNPPCVFGPKLATLLSFIPVLHLFMIPLIFKEIMQRLTMPHWPYAYWLLSLLLVSAPFLLHLSTHPQSLTFPMCLLLMLILLMLIGKIQKHLEKMAGEARKDLAGSQE